MRTDILLTLTGPDRVGVVESATDALLSVGGNVGTSRMARLGGEFAMLMLVTIPVSRVDEIDGAFAAMTAEGYRLTMSTAAAEPVRPHGAGTLHRIEVRGADHEGIIHDIAAGLSAFGINIESMETGTVSAAVTGTPLFTMNALVLVPPSVSASDWTDSLGDAAEAAGVDVVVSPAE